MGVFLDKPKTDKHTEVGAGNGLRYGLSSMQGWRVEMEDAHCAMIGLPQGLKDWSFFAVFDGHAGAGVSAYCAKRLLEAILSNPDFYDSKDPLRTEPTLESVRSGIKTGFLRLDEQIRDLPDTTSGKDKSGSTAVCAMVSPQHVFIANCGDSRGVLSRDGTVAFATYDHKPNNPIEKERIQNAGGSVMIQRVNGSLAVSRALGDFDYKNVSGKGPCEQLVSPEPEVFVEDRSDKDEFLVLACDGIWDVMSNEELCDFVRNRMLVMNNLDEICNSVVDACLSKGSRDNMSVVIVAFAGAPAVSEEAMQKERKLDTMLENKVKEIIQSSAPDATMLQYVMHLLAVEDIEGLPPGGGIYAKRAKIEEIISRLNPNSEDYVSQKSFV